MFNLRKFLGLDFYTSGLDLFLDAYRQKHPRLSDSQQKEVTKYNRLFKLRDKAETPVTTHTPWENF